MKQKAPKFLLWFGVLGFALFLVSASTASAQASTDALILLNANDIHEMDQAVVFIQAQGGRVPITFAPHALLARLPARDVSGWIGQARIAAIITASADADQIEANFGDQAELAARAWNQRLNDARNPVAAPSTPGRDLIRDALIAPDQPARAPRAINAPPSSYYTSEFMSGSVQVDVFLLESNGTIDANTENWTTTMRDNVVNEITAGLNWWITAATQGGRPAANLTFNITFHTPFNEPSIVATGYEPITRPQSNESLWIGQVMANLGYGGSYWSAVRSYDQARRSALGRDWAFSVFVVNSLNDANGLFSDGHFAYSYLYGPFMVMTYDNNGWGISRMDMVSAHETAHIFGALDEYASSGCTDTETSGYLNIANTNCENGTPATENSIMRSSGSQMIAYPSHLVSTPVRGMVGWLDSDGDGIYDVVDTTVQMSATRITIPSTGQPASYTGTATDIPFPPPFGTSMSVNKITQVRYRVNTGSWFNATPTNGAFNEYTEGFSLTTPVLYEGTNTVEIQALNSVGNSALFTQSIVLGSSKFFLPMVEK